MFALHHPLIDSMSFGNNVKTKKHVFIYIFTHNFLLNVTTLTHTIIYINVSFNSPLDFLVQLCVTMRNLQVCIYLYTLLVLLFYIEFSLIMIVSRIVNTSVQRSPFDFSV